MNNIRNRCSHISKGNLLLPKVSRNSRTFYRNLCINSLKKFPRKPHLPCVSMTKGTNSFDESITLLYFENLDLAFITAAAPGKYKGAISEFLTNQSKGLFASIIRKSLLSNLTTRSMRLFLRSLKQNIDSTSTRRLAALQSF